MPHHSLLPFCFMHKSKSAQSPNLFLNTPVFPVFPHLPNTSNAAKYKIFFYFFFHFFFLLLIHSYNTHTWSHLICLPLFAPAVILTSSFLSRSFLLVNHLALPLNLLLKLLSIPRQAAKLGIITRTELFRFTRVCPSCYNFSAPCPTCHLNLFGSHNLLTHVKKISVFPINVLNALLYPSPLAV